MARAGNLMENRVKRRVSTPYPPASSPGRPPHLRSGALMRSIRSQTVSGRGGVRLLLTATVHYAGFLQRGTSRMAARPFLGLREDARVIMNILRGG